jgi:tetratricopeptide (TPR) repeat protein
MEQLKDPATAAEGLAKLESLSAESDGNATFLLSRLYFQSGNPEDVECFDKTEEMRTNAGISIDNGKAHALLERAVEQDAQNYKALYELACDYYNTNQRIKDVKRDTKKALELFGKALPLAEQAGDVAYKKLIGMKKNKLEDRLKQK